MILLDTGPLAALVNPRDADHERAKVLLSSVWRGEYGQPLSTDYVLDEGLTLIQVRTARRDVADRFAAFFYGARDRFEPQVQIRYTGADVLEEATRLHFDAYDRRLSVTDCTLIVHAKRLGALVATFDAGFDGLVPTVG